MLSEEYKKKAMRKIKTISKKELVKLLISIGSHLLEKKRQGVKKC